VAESLEELGFEAVQRLGHDFGASIAGLPSLRVSESIKTGTIAVWDAIAEGQIKGCRRR
jgi:hypothetical protein